MLKMIKGRQKDLKLFVADVTSDQNSASIDLKDLNALKLIFAIGAFAFDGSNKVALKVEHSDDNSTFVACDAADLDASESANIVATVDTVPEGDAIYVAHYRGTKRYVRGVLDITGTVDFAASIVAIGSYPEMMPPL